MWLSTVFKSFRVAPLGARSWLRIGRNHSAMMLSLELGISEWMSDTRPATEFSIGIMARSASSAVTAEKASSKVGHGTGSKSG